MKTIYLTPCEDTKATLTGYLHDQSAEMPQRTTRPCVLIFPGGAYAYCSAREADPIAFSFFARGYHAFILNYSVAGEDGAKAPLGLTPLKEASAAVMLIRNNAQTWGIDPHQIAVCGFSAGGHLAASLGILWNHEKLRAELDTLDGMNRPDAMILAYPVISVDECAHGSSIQNLTGGEADVLSLFALETQVTAQAVPAFIWHTVADATVPVENSMLLAEALHKQGVAFEMHLYTDGGHGSSLCNVEVGSPQKHNASWMSLCAEWLGSRFGFEE